MSMMTYTYSLDMVPSNVKTIVSLNQGDEDFTLIFNLYASRGSFTLESGTTAMIKGTKPDGNGYSVDATIDVLNSTVTVAGDLQMTAAAGKGVFELSLYHGTKKLYSSNFYIVIEHAALDKTTVASDSKVAELYAVEDNAEEIIAAGAQYAAYKEALDETADGAAESARQAKASEDAAAQSLREYNQTYRDDMAEWNSTYSHSIDVINYKTQVISELKTDADAISNRALDLATMASNETSEFATQVASMKTNQTRMQLLLNEAFDGAYIENNAIYFTHQGEVVAGPFTGIGGGGGGGGSDSGNNAVLTVSNTTGWQAMTVSESSECVTRVTWSSIEEGNETGNGTIQVTVNGITKALLNVVQGEVSIDISEYLAVGSNVIKETIKDTYGNSRTVNFSVEMVSISIFSSFDASIAYEGTISFPYTPVGAVSKTIYFLVDGEQIGTTTTSVSGRQMSYTIPQQTHGSHSIECYFDAIINGQTVTSNRLYYEVTCLESLNTDVIITSSFNRTSVDQYSSVPIPFTVYDPLSLTADVSITMNGNLLSNQTVDRTEHSYTIKMSTAGEMAIVISSGGTEKVINLTVIEADIDAEAETEDLALYLTSYGRSNSEAEPAAWEYGNIACQFSGFNWSSDGWQSDSDGITVMRVSGDARIIIPYRPFVTDFRTTGKTIELEFATRNVLNYDSTILSCMSGGRGIEVTAQKALLSSEQSSISTQYKEEEHVRIAFVAEKRSENRLLYIYINGIASGVVQYPADDDFSQVNPVNISIGSSDCTIDLYNIRVYDNDLTRYQILDNWIADTQDGTTLLQRYAHNNVYDAYGNIVIASLPSDLPYLIIECEELPQYKGDKKTVSGTYVDPVYPSRGFSYTGAQANVQGTSSQYYPRKNYKIKFKNGFNMNTGTVEDYPLRSNAIPTNEFCFKADVASSEGANNVELARLYNDACPYKTPAQKEDARIRQGIDGFPIVVFWADPASGRTSFIGKYNFNNDKGTSEVFGFEAPDESWEILNNTSDRVLWKNADYSGDDWLNDFEGRYPEDNTDARQLSEFASWVASTDTEAATDEALDSAVTYDGVTYTADTAEYRLARFKAQAWDYMEEDSTLFYYLFTELFLMVDSRAKNAFPSFIGTEV